MKTNINDEINIPMKVPKIKIISGNLSLSYFCSLRESDKDYVESDTDYKFFSILSSILCTECSHNFLSFESIAIFDVTSEIGCNVSCIYLYKVIRCGTT